MKWTVLIASFLAALGVVSTEPVMANDLHDVVRARANARAGGATSGHDAWVVERHGTLSGATSAAKKSKAAKKRAYQAAKKKKEAERRAYLAAQKKKAAEKAKQEQLAAAEAKARAKAEDQETADAEKKDGDFVSPPSNAALMTGKDVNEDVAEETAETPKTGEATEVAVANEGETAEAAKETAPNVEKSDTDESGCKRFVPAVGLTVSTDC